MVYKFHSLDVRNLYFENNSIQVGTYQISGASSIKQAILHAWNAGYRHIDTAKFYQNESEIGAAIKELPRDQLFITSKLWYSDHGYEKALAACTKTMQRLQVDYLDLYLVHWPGTDNDSSNNSAIRRETWRAMEQLYNTGKCKAIGVSNYTEYHLEQMLRSDSPYKVQIKPMVNQFELHPLLTQKELIAYCNKHQIVVESYSPFAKGKLLGNAELVAIAKKYNKTVAQVIVRWVLQQGIVCIPKSEKKQRIEQNAQVYDFELAAEDVSKIDALNKNWHCTWDPQNVQ